MDLLNKSFLAGIGCGACLVWLLMRRTTTTSSGNPKKPIELGPEVEEESSDDDGDCKLVVVVRTDLKMGKGKIAAQVAHAAVAAYKQAKRWNPDVLRNWEQSGQAKVTLKVSSEEQLREIAKVGRLNGLGVSLIQDQGRTQIARGSTTVLGIGPASSSIIDKVTGHLSLL
ncbi:peptidyl-tRNA hydrolase 2, mitochondrial-like isoform X1 [Cloeon dipterum]|uniref:peptidyl-tRNA hydrolase 2, mitochondrial-like isoform X1 n=1 Tax=Cloeon dipterum TaxID=197152 RepID=UPI00321F8EA1